MMSDIVLGSYVRVACDSQSDNQASYQVTTGLVVDIVWTHRTNGRFGTGKRRIV
jgi:hypothetical protein